MTYNLTTVTACRVANIDRQRFNEYVASGDYPCAPDTVSGRSRLFDESNMVALFAFGRLIEAGMKPFFAGMLACKILANVKAQPNEDVITFALSPPDPRWYPVVNGTDPANPGDVYLSAHDGEILETRSFNVGLIRRTIRQKAEFERSIIGPED